MEKGRFAGRAVLAAVILVNLAVVNILFETRGIRLRYEVAKARETARARELGNRKLRLEVAAARRPDEVVRRAAGCGVDLRERTREAETSGPPEPPAAGAPGERTTERREAPRREARDPNDEHPLLRN